MYMSLGLVYVLNKKNNISTYALILSFIAILLNFSALLGLYSYTLFGVGFDKWLHVTAAFLVLPIVYDLFNQRAGFAFLGVMGLGAVVEMIEFTGFMLLDIETGGVLAMGNNNAAGEILSLFDTQFDILFNAAGAALSIVVIYFRKLLRR